MDLSPRGTGFLPVSVPPPGSERLVHAAAAAAGLPCHDARESAPERRVPAPAPAATPLDDPRWSTPVGLPHEAFSKVAHLAGSGTPIQHLANIAIYNRSARGLRQVSPRQALSAFEAALTLVLANGQIAAEAMFQAGIPNAEIDDRITRFTKALHAASTSGLDASMPHASMPSSDRSLVAVASERGSGVLSAAPGNTPGVAFSSQAAGDSLPPAGSTPTAAGASAPAPAVSPAAVGGTFSGDGD